MATAKTSPNLANPPKPRIIHTMHPTPLDIAIAIGLVFSVLAACHRGLGREMLHTVLFAIVVAIGYLLFRNAGNAAEDRTVFWLVNSTYYVITAYILTWVGMKVLSPLMLSGHDSGLRSRFWAGVLSLAKLATVIFGLNLWFALHSPVPHPERIETLPPIMRNSVLIRMADNTTERLYLWLQSNSIVNPVLPSDTKQELETMLIPPSSTEPLAPVVPPAPLQPDEQPSQ